MNVKKSFKINFNFFILFFIGFFCLPLYKVFAALELQYPKISGQTIDSSFTFPDFALYLFNAGIAVGIISVFISLVIAGVMYFLSPVKPEMKLDAKDRISGALSGFLILVLTYLIVTTINPALSVFSLNKQEATTQNAEPEKNSGVYFNTDKMFATSNVPDLGELKNIIQSVEVVNHGTSFLAILYDNTNFWGKCLGLTGSGNPSNPSWADSASIHQMIESNGDGVYFYRKSYFDEKGGYLKVDNSKIIGGYNAFLEDLSFTGTLGGSKCNVPEEEQGCNKYDKNGKCCTEVNKDLKCDGDGRVCPTLGGENISSVQIKGNYIVLFVYASPTDNKDGPWSFCQEFPTVDDYNKIGPKQIKWQNIRNSSLITGGDKSVGGFLPNWVVILPI